jgi:hypothetical protein
MRLAAATPFADISGEDSGQVQVYRWTGSDWVQMGQTLLARAAMDHFGRKLSLSADGRSLAVGAAYSDSNGVNSGQVRVFRWSGSDWLQSGADINGRHADEHFGSSIGLSEDGSRLAVGAWGNSDNGERAGQVRIYQFEEDQWVQLGAGIDGEAARDYSGDLALSANGNRVAIGATLNDGNGESAGHVRIYDLSEFNGFTINAGMNDAWYNPATDGQGFLISVFPEHQLMFLAWFTYDTERPPEDVTAYLGEPGHRWLTAQGPYDGDTAELTLYVTSGGVFDQAEPSATVDLSGEGTLTIEFADCTEALVSYDIDSLGLSGTIPIQRIIGDNVPLCEELAAE